MPVLVNGSICPYSYEVIDELKGKNITEITKDDVLKWPCELISFWISLLPFVKIVKFLMSYGTSVIVAFGVFGNTISLIVLTQSKMRKNPPNLYLIILAVYDLCTLLLNFMTGVLRGNFETVNHVFQDSETLCTIHSVAVELFNILSVWMIVAFTVERYIMIRYSLKVRPSRRKTCIVILVLSFVMFLISLHKIGVSGFEGDSVYGYKACKTRRVIFKEIIAVYVALNTWLPTMLIAMFNIGIILELRISRKLNGSPPIYDMSEADDRTTKLLLLVSTRYLLLVLPLGVVQTTELIWNQIFTVAPSSPDYVNFMITKFRLKWTRAFFFFFYQFNFAINIIIYVTSPAATHFRKCLYRIFGMKPKSKNIDFS